MNLRKERGFTLIEVLVAAVIMFTVLATATASLRAAMHASERASITTELLAPLPFITPTIREALRNNPEPERSGAGAMFGVEYRYHARMIRLGSPPRQFDPDVADFVDYAPRFGLYDVELELELDGEKKSFLYQELTWQALER
jgi:prepilin-type N-terminal cleavage/methylation domain-containing protein